MNSLQQFILQHEKQINIESVLTIRQRTAATVQLDQYASPCSDFLDGPIQQLAYV